MKTSIDILLPDGSQTQISIFAKESETSTPLFLLFPAMGVKAAYYEPFARVLAAQDYTVVTADLRGLGTSSIRPSRATDYGYEEMLQLDYLAIFKTIDQQFPQKEKYVLGHSLGGQLACLFLSRHVFDIKGLILLASCSVHYSGWEGWGRWRVKIATHLFPLIAKSLGYFPGDRIGFGGKAARQHLLDWSDQGRTGKYRPAHTNFDYEAALGQLKIKTLAINIEEDALAPEKAIKNLYEKFHPNSVVTPRTFTSAMAGDFKPNHFNWARKPEGIVQLIEAWVKESED